MPARPRTIRKMPSSATLAADRLGVAAVVLYVISAAPPLTAVAGVVPTRVALAGLTGGSHAHPGAAVVCALVSVDRVALSRDIFNSATSDVYIAPGLSRPAGVCASWVASAYNLVSARATVDSGRSSVCHASRSTVFLTLVPGSMTGGGRVR